MGWRGGAGGGEVAVPRWGGAAEVAARGGDTVADGAVAVFGLFAVAVASGDGETCDADPCAGAGRAPLTDGVRGAVGEGAAGEPGGGTDVCGGGRADGVDAGNALAADGAAVGVLCVSAGAGAAVPVRADSALGSGSTAAHAATKRQHTALAVRNICSRLTDQSPPSADP